MVFSKGIYPLEKRKINEAGTRKKQLQECIWAGVRLFRTSIGTPNKIQKTQFQSLWKLIQEERSISDFEELFFFFLPFCCFVERWEDCNYLLWPIEINIPSHGCLERQRCEEFLVFHPSLCVLVCSGWKQLDLVWQQWRLSCNHFPTACVFLHLDKENLAQQPALEATRPKKTAEPTW